jgi:hypothetical protein
MKVFNPLFGAAILATFALPITARAGGSSPPVDICNPDVPVDPPGDDLPVDPPIDDDLPIDGLAEMPDMPDCDAPPPERAPDPNTEPPEFTRTRLISRTIVIDRPGTFDFGSELLKWSGREECKPQRNPIPILEVRSSNVVIKNLAYQGSPGGVVVSGINVKFENVTGWSCGQAFTTSGGADRISLKDSRFYGNPEHAVGLLNLTAGDMVIDNTLFAEAATCLAFGGGQTVKLSNSDFFGCATSIKGDIRNNNRVTIFDADHNESWHGTLFYHLIDHVRATSVGDLVYDGEFKKLEKDASLIQR